jgi:hypothetical protein
MRPLKIGVQLPEVEYSYTWPRIAEMAGIAVHQVIAEPDRIEADVFGEPGHFRELRPGARVLDLGKLDANLQRTHGFCSPLRGPGFSAGKERYGAHQPDGSQHPDSNLCDAAARTFFERSIASLWMTRIGALLARPRQLTMPFTFKMRSAGEGEERIRPHQLVDRRVVDP